MVHCAIAQLRKSIDYCTVAHTLLPAAAGTRAAVATVRFAQDGTHVLP